MVDRAWKNLLDCRFKSAGGVPNSVDKREEKVQTSHVAPRRVTATCGFAQKVDADGKSRAVETGLSL